MIDAIIKFATKKPTIKRIPFFAAEMSIKQFCWSFFVPAGSFEEIKGSKKRKKRSTDRTIESECFRHSPAGIGTNGSLNRSVLIAPKPSLPINSTEIAGFASYWFPNVIYRGSRPKLAPQLSIPKPLSRFPRSIASDFTRIKTRRYCEISKLAVLLSMITFWSRRSLLFLLLFPSFPNVRLKKFAISNVWCFDAQKISLWFFNYIFLRSDCSFFQLF